MNLTKVPLNSINLTLYIEDEQALVFHRENQSLFSISAAAITLLIALNEFEQVADAFAHVEQLTSLELSQIENIYHELTQLLKATNKQRYIDGQYPELNTEFSANQLLTKQLLKVYQVANTNFAMQSDCLLIEEECEQLFSPILTENHQPNFYFSIVKNKQSQYQLLCNGLTIEDNLLFAQVIPHIVDRMQIIAFQNTDFQFCFHAASLKKGDQVYLLPGVSGAGKSTLSAILASKDAELFSDEMLVFDKHFNLLTLQLPIAVKSGSWQVLINDYPELENITEWYREDGRRLKYVWPKTFAHEKAHRNFSLINPAYSVAIEGKESSPSVQKQALSVIATVELLVKAGYQVHRQLNEETLESFFSLLERMAKQRVQYSSSEQILRFLTESESRAI